MKAELALALGFSGRTYQYGPAYLLAEPHAAPGNINHDPLSRIQHQSLERAKVAKQLESLSTHHGIISML